LDVICQSLKTDLIKIVVSHLLYFSTFLNNRTVVKCVINLTWHSNQSLISFGYYM